MAIEETEAKTVVTSCPFCESNLAAGAKLAGSDVEVIDVVDLLKRAIE